MPPRASRSTPRGLGALRVTRAARFIAIAALVFVSACARGVLPLPGVRSALATGESLSVGEWIGTTSQGAQISFTVAADETLTALTIGYDFNECSGLNTFTGLNVRTAPDLVCVSGPCPASAASFRQFGFLDGSFGGGPVTQVNGIFLPGREAQGQANFFDYSSCGTVTAVQWTARKRRE